MTIEDMLLIDDAITSREKPYEFVLEGGGGLAEVPAIDVASFITGVVRLVALAAGHAVGRPVKETGRRESIVEVASRVRLQSIRSGSVALSFLPAAHESFPLGDDLDLDAETVSESALSIVYRIAGGALSGYPDVARAWTDLGDTLGVGDRYQGISVTAPGEARVQIDRPNLDRLRVSGRQQPVIRKDLVDGVLYEADFEGLSAKLRDGNGSSVLVAFDLKHAELIKDALRNRTTLIGHVAYDETTHRVVSVRVESVQKPVQLSAEDFWAEKSSAELIAEHGIESIADVSRLRIPGVSEAEWAAFFEAIGVAD